MPATLPALDLAELFKGIPRGAWVAISSRHEKVVAYGSELRAVLEEAKQKGEEHPLIARVPETTVFFNALSGGPLVRLHRVSTTAF